MGAAMRELVESVQAEQRSRWERGEWLAVEDYLERYPALKGDATAVVDLVYGEVLLREELGEVPTVEEYLQRFTEFAEPLRRQFRLHECLRAGMLESSAPPDSPASNLCLFQAIEAGLLESSAPPDSRPTAAESTLAVRRPLSSGGTGELPTIPGHEVLRRLGGGGQGIVYAARQLKPPREVAVKVIRQEDGAKETREEALFYRDAKAVARLEHPNIIRLYEFGEHAGRSYYTMELAAGGSLQQLLIGGPLPPREAASLVETLARALHYAHERGIVHRDLKPGNVLLAADGTPKLADFGLAKKLGGGDSLLPSDAIVGTVNYMAPEQATASKEVGPAADIYGLGAVLYECLTGRPPFQGANLLDTLEQVRSREPASPRGINPAVSRDLDTVCLKCLEKEPRKRYAGALDLAGRLRLVLDNKPIPDRPRGWLAKGWQALRSHPRLCTGLPLLGLLIGVLLWANRAPRSQEVGNRPDPERLQREVEARLAEGLRYEFRGDEPLPGPFRWVVGAGVPLERNEARWVSVPLTTSLLEVVSDPGCDRYRFSVELRHDDWAGASMIGLYFGRRQHRTVQGQPCDSFYTLNFPDRGVLARHPLKPNGDPFAWVRLQAHLFERGSGNEPRPMAVAGREQEFRPALPMGGPAPWRTLEVKVTPEAIETFWKDDAGALVRLSTLTAKELVYFMEVAKRDHVPSMRGVPTSFRPRSGLGLYFYRGAASFRRVVVEPLAGGG